MKQFFLLLGSSLLLTGSAHAQFGLRAGTTLMHLRAGDDLEARGGSSASKFGYQVGVFYTLKLGSHLALVPEIQYSREHAALVTPNSGAGIPEYTYRNDLHQSLSYLNIPVLLRANFGVVYVEAGPQMSELLQSHETGASYTYLSPTNFLTQEVDRSNLSYYQRVDFGPCLGIGAKLPAGFGFSVRAYQGLTSVVRDQGDFTPGYAYRGPLHRQTLQASLTYQLATRQ